MKIRVEHQSGESRFVVKTDNQESLLEYELMPRNGINFTFTFVPDALRGHGIAEKLVRAGLAWARQEGFEVQASCWYVRRFLR